MANGRPWYQRNGAAFVLGTLHMPMEARLAYSLIIDMLNDRDTPLPDDADYICGFTKFSKRKWASVREFLLHDLNADGEPRIMLTDRGELTNPRFERERAERQKAHEQSVKAGRDGGKKSAAIRQGALALDDAAPENQPKSRRKPPQESSENSTFRPKNISQIEDVTQKINDLTIPPPQAPRAGASPRQRLEIREEEKEEEDSGPIDVDSRPPVRDPEPSPDPVDPLALADHFCRIAGTRNIDPARIIANANVVREWLALGIGIAEIEGEIIRTRDKSSNGIYSLNYFDTAIRRLQARKDHPNASRSRDETLDDIRDPVLRRYLENGGTLGIKY